MLVLENVTATGGTVELQSSLQSSVEKRFADMLTRSDSFSQSWDWSMLPEIRPFGHLIGELIMTRNRSHCNWLAYSESDWKPIPSDGSVTWREWRVKRTLRLHTRCTDPVVGVKMQRGWRRP